MFVQINLCRKSKWNQFIYILIDAITIQALLTCQCPLTRDITTGSVSLYQGHCIHLNAYPKVSSLVDDNSINLYWYCSFFSFFIHSQTDVVLVHSIGQVVFSLWLQDYSSVHSKSIGRSAFSSFHELPRGPLLMANYFVLTCRAKPRESPQQLCCCSVE